MKGKSILVMIREEVKERGCFNHKRLERYRGFLFICFGPIEACVPVSKGYIIFWIGGGWEETKLSGNLKSER